MLICIDIFILSGLIKIFTSNFKSWLCLEFNNSRFTWNLQLVVVESYSNNITYIDYEGLKYHKFFFSYINILYTNLTSLFM